MPDKFQGNHINCKNLSRSVVLLCDHHVKTTLLCPNQTKINMFYGDTKHLIKMLKTRPDNQNTLKSCWVNWPFSADPTKGVGSAVWTCNVAFDWSGLFPKVWWQKSPVGSEQTTLRDNLVRWPLHLTQSFSFSFHLTKIHSFQVGSFYRILIMPIFFYQTICFFLKLYGSCHWKILNL